LCRAEADYHFSLGSFGEKNSDLMDASRAFFWKKNLMFGFLNRAAHRPVQHMN